MDAFVPPMRMGERSSPPDPEDAPDRDGSSPSAVESQMDVDYTINVDETISQARLRAEEGRFDDAISLLLTTEKQTRLAQQGESTTKLIVEIIQICGRSSRWSELNEQCVVLSKKRGQIKQAISQMVQEAMTFVPLTPDLDTRIALIQTLRGVTEGKIYVELERAKLIRTLAEIREGQGDVGAASDLMQEVQIETIGTMSDSDKIDFILETMRLTLARGDPIRVYIISKKITSRSLARPGFEDLKMRYHALLVKYWKTQSNYLEICRSYHSVFQLFTPHAAVVAAAATATPTPTDDDTPMPDSDSDSVAPGTAVGTAKKQPFRFEEEQVFKTLEFMCLYCVLAPYGNEQRDLLNRIFRLKKLDDIQMTKMKEFVKLFLRDELIVWAGSLVPKTINIWLGKHPVFTEDSERIEVLRNGVVEHNLRVVGKFYQRIQVPRLTFLLGTQSDEETETVVAKLVVEGVIRAKIDRIDGVVEFARVKGPMDGTVDSTGTGAGATSPAVLTTKKNVPEKTEEDQLQEVLSGWSSEVSHILGLVGKVNHLISKERMVLGSTQLGGRRGRRRRRRRRTQTQPESEETPTPTQPETPEVEEEEGETVPQ